MIRRSRLATALGVTGSAFGLVAGLVQTLAGSRIPDWTGDKQEPFSLGLLTIGLSLIAGYAVLGLRRHPASIGLHTAGTLGVLVPALLCFTTVGRLWYLPGALLIAAGLLGLGRVAPAAALLSHNWSRVLLILLGASELVMAAGRTRCSSSWGRPGGSPSSWQLSGPGPRSCWGRSGPSVPSRSRCSRGLPWSPYFCSWPPSPWSSRCFATLRLLVRGQTFKIFHRHDDDRPARVAAAVVTDVAGDGMAGDGVLA